MAKTDNLKLFHLNTREELLKFLSSGNDQNYKVNVHLLALIMKSNLKKLLKDQYLKELCILVNQHCEGDAMKIYTRMNQILSNEGNLENISFELDNVIFEKRTYYQYSNILKSLVLKLSDADLKINFTKKLVKLLKNCPKLCYLYLSVWHDDGIEDELVSLLRTLTGVEIKLRTKNLLKYEKSFEFNRWQSIKLATFLINCNEFSEEYLCSLRGLMIYDPFKDDPFIYKCLISQFYQKCPGKFYAHPKFTYCRHSFFLRQVENGKFNTTYDNYIKTRGGFYGRNWRY